MGDLFSIHTLIIQIINLGIVLFILHKFLFKPYLGYVLEQEKKQKQIEKSTETIRLLQEKSEKEIQSLFAEANMKAASIREQAKGVATSQAEEIIVEAHEQAKRISDRAHEHISILERELQERYTQTVTQSVLSLNKKMFLEKADTNTDFIQTHIK